MIVVDSNILIYSLVENERSRMAEQLKEKDPVWKFPILWQYEFGNALVLMARKNELTAKTAVEVLDLARVIFSSGATEVDLDLALRLSMDRNLTFYDAQFLALANMLNAKLVTEDKALRKASEGLAVSMEEFLR